MTELTYEKENKINDCLYELKMLGELLWQAGFADEHTSIISKNSLITLGEKIRDIAYDLDSCLNGEKEAKNEQSIRKAN